MSRTGHQSISPMDIDQRLMSICTELVRKNKQIKLDKVYYIARRELTADVKDILNGIKRLEENMMIKADSRLLKKDLLQNMTRKELYHLIFRNPGISFNQIRKQMGKGTKILLWHVQLLLDFKCVLERVFENAKAFFTHHFRSSTWTEDDLMMFILFQNQTVKRILDVLSSGNSCSVKDIEQRLEISRQLVEYHLKKLSNSGTVESIIGDVKQYYLT
nr:winged helix-turn-helix transcriptional regulator [Candidatus Sigynarchaeota archaeon]